METNTKLQQQEIISLLLADMRNRKLIIGLERIGLRSDDFYTDLSECILRRMGFPAMTDALYDWYEFTLEDLIEMDIDYFFQCQRELAARMYDKLLLKRMMEKA